MYLSLTSFASFLLIFNNCDFPCTIIYKASYNLFLHFRYYDTEAFILLLFSCELSGNTVLVYHQLEINVMTLLLTPFDFLQSTLDTQNLFSYIQTCVMRISHVRLLVSH